MNKFDVDLILFTAGPKAYAPKRLVKEAKLHKIKLKIIEYKDINIKYSDKEIILTLKNRKMPIARGIFLRGLGEDSVYNPIRTAIIKWYKSKGSKVLNSKSFDKWPSLDKTTQHINLVLAGIPVVESFSFSSDEELSKWSKKSYPYIAKEVTGSCGTGVYKISDDIDLLALIKLYNSKIKIKTLLFQRFLTGAYDLRVITLGNKIVGAMKRIAAPDNYLTNYSQGGTVEEYDIEGDPEAAGVALKTTKLFGLDYCGIDLMKDHLGRWVVLEVNRACQFEGFEQATNINIASKIIDYLA